MKCVHIDSPQGVIPLIKVDNVVCPKWRTYFGFPVDTQLHPLLWRSATRYFPVPLGRSRKQWEPIIEALF